MVVLLTLASACSPEVEVAESSVASTSTRHGGTVAATELQLIHHDIERGEGMPAAGVTGTLELGDNGCLTFARADIDQDLLPLWPGGFTARLFNEGAVVFDDEGSPFAEAGEEMTLGGGGIPANLAEERAVEGLPDCDVDGYWLTSWDRLES
jgi:hypothetical protein